MNDATDVPAHPSWWHPVDRRKAGPGAERGKSAEAVPPKTELTPSAPPERKESWSTLWLTDRDIVVFTAVAAVVLVLLVVRWAQISGWGRR